MLTQAYINIVLQAFGGMVSLMMVVFLRFVRRERSELDKLYMRFLLCNTLIQFVDVVSWYVDGRQGQAVHMIAVVTAFLAYALHYLLLGTLTDYLVAFLENNGARCRRVSHVVWTIALIGIALVVVSQFNGMYYTIDAQSRYVRGAFVPLFAAIGISGVVIDLCLFVYHRKKLRKNEYRVFTACLLFSIVSLIFQALVLGAFYLYITTTFIAVCIYIFIQVEQTNRFSEQALELERSRTAVMVSQIQPHFLYNSLTGIKELCRKEPEKAADAMDHFSYFLRSNLDSLSDIRLIPFDKEMSHVRDYFYLEKMRFGNRVSLTLELEFTDFRLPPMTLQPLVENAVRYGITKKDSGGTVTLRSEQQDGQVLITITDDGMGFDVNAPMEDGRTHTGIKNVRSRLELQCGGTLEIKSIKGAGCEVRITLPEGRRFYEDDCGR